MPDKATDEGFGIADLYPGLPSFVRQIREMGPDDQIADCFDHWSPQGITGEPVLDFERGRQHCAAAMAFSHQIGTANFILYVVMAMQGSELGAIERGFIAELMGPALSGRIPPVATDAVMQEIAKDGGAVGVLREHEQFMARAIPYGRSHPELFYNYVIELISGDQGYWIGAAISLLVGTALNGDLH